MIIGIQIPSPTLTLIPCSRSASLSWLVGGAVDGTDPLVVDVFVAGVDETFGTGFLVVVVCMVVVDETFVRVVGVNVGVVLGIVFVDVLELFTIGSADAEVVKRGVSVVEAAVRREVEDEE